MFSKGATEIQVAMRIDELSTDRFQFRMMRSDDALAFVSFYSDPETARFLTAKVGDPEEESRRFVEYNVRENQFGMGQFAIEHRDSGKLIGSAGFVITVVDDAFEVELCGRALPQHRYNGFGVEIGQALIEWAKTDELCNEHISLVHIENKPAQRLCEKLGMAKSKQVIYDRMKVALFKRK